MAKINKAKTGAAIISVIAAFIAVHEGFRSKAYPDPGKPEIATICFGETKGVYFGMTRSKQECVDMLKNRIPDFLGPVDKLMPNLPDNARIAYADFAYNLGAGTLQRSGIAALENSGRYKEACSKLLRYVYAGKKILPGLVTRRKKEYELCLKR